MLWKQLVLEWEIIRQCLPSKQQDACQRVKAK